VQNLVSASDSMLNTRLLIINWYESDWHCIKMYACPQRNDSELEEYTTSTYSKFPPPQLKSNDPRVLKPHRYPHPHPKPLNPPREPRNFNTKNNSAFTNGIPRDSQGRRKRARRKRNRSFPYRIRALPRYCRLDAYMLLGYPEWEFCGYCMLGCFCLFLFYILCLVLIACLYLIVKVGVFLQLALRTDRSYTCRGA
jgi:hypothetical protein